MAKGGNTGPNRGPISVATFITNSWRTSLSQPFAVFTFPTAGRILGIRIRTLNLGTGTLTAYQIRRAAAGASVVTTGGTQCLGADGGAVTANTTVRSDPDQTSGADLYLEAQRTFAQFEQIGVFGTTDAGTANGVVVEITWFPREHYRTVNEVD